MLKVNYEFTALSPIHHGADTDLGIIKMLRKNKVFGLKRELYSRFGFDRESISLKYRAIAYLLLKMWDKMENKDRYTIYEEIGGKLLASAHSRSKYEFLESLSARLEVRSVSMSLANNELTIIDIIDMFDDYELLETIRNGSIYIVAYFRQLKEVIAEELKTAKTSPTLAALLAELKPYKAMPFQSVSQQNSYEFVPLISGNSIRGMLRRDIMEDYCENVGVETLLSRIYHMLFTGGTLQKSIKGSGFEDIGKREELLRMCPPLRLFGAAISNQTIQGELRVNQAQLKCIENGNGNNSLHDLTEIVFATRLDSSKTESKIKIIGPDDETHQMKFYLETYCIGAQFEHGFTCVSDKQEVLSVFHQLLHLFTINNHIAAKESVGFGEIDNSSLRDHISHSEREKYLSYLHANRSQIQDFWNNTVN